MTFFTYHLTLNVKYAHVFLKFPMSFDYSANVFKRILKKYPRDRIYVKTP